MSSNLEVACGLIYLAYLRYQGVEPEPHVSGPLQDRNIRGYPNRSLKKGALEKGYLHKVVRH